MYYFAYGSNMTINRLRSRGLDPLATVGIGYIDHWQIVFNKRSQKDPTVGFANIVPCWGERVYGVIFELRESDVVKLDKFEGYPKHYERTVLSVMFGDDTRYDCVTYIACRKWTVPASLHVSDEYRGHIVAGIRENLSTVSFTNEYTKKLHELMHTPIQEARLD